MIRGEIDDRTFINYPKIRLDLDRSKHAATIRAFIQPKFQSRATIAGGCFTLYPQKSTSVDIYVALLNHNQEDLQTEIANLKSSERARQQILNEINRVLVNPIEMIDELKIGDDFNQNVICQTEFCMVHVEWRTTSEDKFSKVKCCNILARVLFTTRELNCVDTLLNTFELHPNRIAFKNGTFFFSDWFIRGGSIVALPYKEPSDDFIERYLEKGFERVMCL